MLREAMILFSAILSMGNITIDENVTIYNTGTIQYTGCRWEHCYEIESNDGNDGKLLVGMDEVVLYAKSMKNK